MANRVKPRTVAGYTRDVHTLQRLRSAVLLDRSISTDLRNTTVKQVDALVTSLLALTHTLASAIDSA